MSGRTLIMFEKYYPIAAVVGILFAHIIWMVAPIDIRPYTGTLCGCSILPLLILIGYSKKHYFCSWHRVLLYTIMLNVVIYAVDYALFSIGVKMFDIFYVTLFLTTLAALISTVLYVKYGCFKTNRKCPQKSCNGRELRELRQDERERQARIYRSIDELS